MKEITEDYVSYEIAKLLKEKGFDVPVQRVYSNKGEICETYCDYSNQYKYYDWLYPCASQSLALKWLREVHNIYIDILTYTTGKNIQFRWVGYDKGRINRDIEANILDLIYNSGLYNLLLNYMVKNHKYESLTFNLGYGCKITFEINTDDSK